MTTNRPLLAVSRERRRARRRGAWLTAALVAGCAASSRGPAPGTAVLAGTLRLVPHEGVTLPRGGGSYGDRALRDAELVDYSKPNAFDLGLYPKGDARSITIREPGAIRIFCSIHKSMNAVIFAAPTPWHTLAAEDGCFRLADVPAGRYAISSWNERLPTVTSTVEVHAGEVTEVPLTIAASGG